MRKIYAQFLLGFFIVLGSLTANGQVSVTATAGTTGPTLYTNLSSAFSAINAGTHQGNITVDITGNFTDAAVSVLNSSGAGTASYTSVLIRPTVDNATMSFATATGRGVIELNGADNVTIDGDNPNTGGTNRNLTITNTATNTVTFTSVIRLATSTLVTSANDVTIRNLNLTGSGTNRNTASFTSEVTTWGVIASAGASTAAATTAPSALTSATTAVPSGQTHTNLLVQNNNIQSVARGISTNGSATTVAAGLLVENNVIGNATVGATDQVTAVGITVQGSANGIVRGNIVRVEGFIGSSTPNRAINVGMVSTAGVTGFTIEGNIIERMYNNNTGTWPATGIDISGGNGHIIRNNFVTNVLNNQVAGTGAFGTLFAAYGIRINAGTGHSILHNSVHLSGSMPGVISTNITAAFTMTATSQTGADVRNNIFSNQVTGGNPTGTRNVAVFIPSGATSTMNLTLNNNAYLGSADGNSRLAQVGTTFGTGEFTYANFNPAATSPATNFRAYTSTLSAAGTNDNASVAFVANPPFVSNTDLHIPNGTTTVLESAGATTSVATDIDGNPRNATTPDIGADEFAGIYNADPFGPNITYTLLSNSICVGPRNFTAVIVDVPSGVDVTPGTRPRVWFRKSTNANALPATNDNTTNGWKYAEATNAFSPFQFTIDPSLIFGGVALGDVIEYFVVAQDLAATPNVSINSGTFASAATSVSLAPGNFPIGGTINSFSFATGITGTVTIGASGTYPSLTGAGGLFADLNSGGISGNVTAEILDATVTETGANALTQLSYGCGGPFTLTIKPASGVTATLTGSFASGALIRVLSSNVIIDGSNNGTNTRNLTIANTATTAPSVLLIGSTGTTPVTNTQLKNSIIINGSNTASAVVVSDAALGTAGWFNNITIQNNSFQRAFIGNYNIAVVAPGNGSGLLVTGNDFNTAGANSIRLVGVYVQGVDGATVTNNNIGNFANTADASNITGIWFATATANSTISGNAISTMSGTSSAPRGIVVSSGIANANITVSDNSVENLTSSSTGTTTGIFVFSTTSGVAVTGNTVRNIKNTNTTGFGSNGIQLGSTLTAANISVNNNFVSDVAADGFNGTGVADNGYGIIVTAGGGYNIHFNTVLLNTNQTEVGGLPSAMHIIGVTTAGSVNLTNNIFVNTQTVGTNRYAISTTAANTIFGSIDHNVYYSDGPNLGFIGVNRADLAAIQTGFGGNLKSLDLLPTFVSATDLHLSNAPGVNWCINGAGNTVAAITLDIDGDTRQVGTAPAGPDPGADEFTTTGFVVSNPAAICDGSSVDLTAAAVTAGSLGGLAFEYYTDAAATSALANPNAVTVAGTYYIKAINGSCSVILPVVVTINPKPTISGVVVQPTTCVSTDGSITLTLGGAVGPYSFAWIGTGVNPSAQDQTNLTAGSYSVTVTAANGCTEVALFNLPGPGGCNICPGVPTVTTTPATTSCTGVPTTITASGLTDMGVTYGITFKYSTSALADPYSGGTVIATVPNGSLTSGATVATTTHNFAATGNYIIYAILSPVPADPGCRPFAQVNLTVNSAPTVTCPANITVSNDVNQCGAIVNYPPASGTGVPAPTITYDIPSGSFFPVGTTTVTATATNGCGTTTCTFTITVNDTQSPTITCPSNITASNTAGLCSATVNTPNPTPTDNCPGFVVTWALTGATTGTSPATGVNFVGSRSFNVGVTTVTYTIRDASNNSSTCSFTVTVNDTQAPTVTCPANITASNGAGVCSASVNTPNPSNSDNCGVTIRTWALTGATTGASPATGLNNVGTQTFNVGVTTVTYTVTDAAGNTGTCSFTVTVNDTQAPVISCPANITVSTPVGSCTAVVNYTVTATDNCPGVTTALLAGLASGSSFPVGVTTVTHRATDAAGNTATCSFTVTVTDGQLPVISAQPASQTSCVGSSATFSVTASNATGYQWQVFNGGTWNNINGATSSTHTVNNLTTAMNTNTYRVIISGLCSSVTSNMATLFVNTLPQISLHPSMAPTLQPGDVMSITATGIPPGGSYVWLLDGNVIAGASGNVLNNVTVNGLGSYTVRYTDPRGCVSTSAPLVVTGTASNNVWVYPNPNNGQFQVRVFATGSTGPLTIRVYDSKGSLVYEKEHQTVLPFTQMDVNLGLGSSGMYTVRVHDGSGKIIGAKSVLVKY